MLRLFIKLTNFIDFIGVLFWKLSCIFGPPCRRRLDIRLSYKLLFLSRGWIWLSGSDDPGAAKVEIVRSTLCPQQSQCPAIGRDHDTDRHLCDSRDRDQWLMGDSDPALALAHVPCHLSGCCCSVVAMGTIISISSRVHRTLHCRRSVLPTSRYHLYQKWQF